MSWQQMKMMAGEALLHLPSASPHRSSLVETYFNDPKTTEPIPDAPKDVHPPRAIFTRKVRIKAKSPNLASPTDG